MLRFLKNEIPIFGSYYSEFDKTAPLRHCMNIRINDLETREEVLTWYLQFNGAGTPHTKEELDKVKNLLKKEKSNDKI